MTILQIALACLGSLVVLGTLLYGLYLLIIHAPEGYQTRKGFFYGEQKK